MDAARLAAALVSAAETERGIRWHLEQDVGPAELARGWDAYRNAVGLRKALERWMEMRRWRASHPDADESVGAVTA